MSLKIIMAPYDVYWAPVGEAFPVVEVAPAGNWIVLGSVGALNINEDGVTVSGPQTFEQFRSAGSAAPQEVSRTEEDVIVALQLHDLDPAMLRLALNQNAVANTAAGGGFAGFDEIPLERGAGKPNEIALLVRGPSPLFDGGNAQFELKRCYNSGTYELGYSKNITTGIQLEFTALRATSAPFLGNLVSQASAVV